MKVTKTIKAAATKSKNAATNTSKWLWSHKKPIITYPLIAIGATVLLLGACGNVKIVDVPQQ